MRNSLRLTLVDMSPSRAGDRSRIPRPSRRHREHQRAVWTACVRGV